MATDGQRLVRRFSKTERALHWIHAAAFFALLITGVVLYLPALGGALGSREAVKTVHLYTALGWAVALALVIVVGNRAALRRTLHQINWFDIDDRRWLSREHAPQGRFNAGQKLHTVVQAAFAVLFAFSGLLLWLGEQNTHLRFSGTIILHDGLTLMATTLVAGHLYLALISPRTRHSMRGIVLGTVRQDWARAHHAKWCETEEVPPR
jgi:formate dehydrogenase subunit gamma